MSRTTQFAPRNSAKLKVLRFLASDGRYVSAKRLMPLFNIRSYRNVYNVLGRMRKWELVTRHTGPLGLAEWTITAKGKDRLDYYIRKGVGVTA